MKPFSKKLSIMATVIGIISAASAYAANFNATAKATIVDRLTISQLAPLSFGTFSVGSGGGTIDSAGTASGDIISMNGVSHGKFTVAGRPSTSVTVTGDPTVTWANNTANLSASLQYPNGVSTNSSGDANFDVTGILTVPANAATGTYTGTYNVSVNY